MSIFDNTTRTLGHAGSIYFLKVQGYQFPVAKDDSASPSSSRYQLVLKTYIEIIETPISSTEGRLIGMLAKSDKQATEPTFVKLSDPNFHSLKAEFIGDEGFKSAKVQLANFSHNALIKGIVDSFHGGDIERDFIFELCWFNVYTRRYFSVDRLELKLKQAPEEFTHDRAIYTLSRTEKIEGGATYCVYILKEATSGLERDFVLRTYKKNKGDSRRRWIPVNEIKLKLIKAPPEFTDKGVNYKLEGKVIEAEDGTIYANYIPTQETGERG